MIFLSAVCSDIGILKKTNQDSYCLKIAQTSIGKVLMGIICDGMGGLSKGELASASVIRTFSDWFDNDLSNQLLCFNEKNIVEDWQRIIQEQNIKIAQYGKKNGISLGTTFSAILIIGNQKIIVGHVGDSRAYLISDKIDIITEDQTIIGRELRRGNMTIEQAKTDPRRNVLLQCIGASKAVEPDFICMTPSENTVWLLCSDGFRHLISNEELFDVFRPDNLNNENLMQQKIKDMIELNKNRRETDNITAMLIKLVKKG